MSRQQSIVRGTLILLGHRGDGLGASDIHVDTLALALPS